MTNEKRIQGLNGDEHKKHETGSSEEAHNHEKALSNKESSASNVSDDNSSTNMNFQVTGGRSESSDGTKTEAAKSSNPFIGFLRSMEEFLFPRSPLVDELAARHPSTQQPKQVRGGVLLEGCNTPEEHYSRIKEALAQVQGRRGADGLRTLGLEYRMVYCDAHLNKSTNTPTPTDRCSTDGGIILTDLPDIDTTALHVDSATPSSETDMNSAASTGSSVHETLTLESAPLDSNDPIGSNGMGPHYCAMCMRRLYHASSNTLVSEDNRKLFIADGDMYEAVANLCQEYAQDVMCEEYKLSWITVEEGQSPSSGSCQLEPIRLMLSSEHPLAKQIPARSGDDNMQTGHDTPTVLLATGRGKVRAGIFSRKHLMFSGLESATALPMVREARRRGLNVMIVDPNVHGDRYGYITFEKYLDFYHQKMIKVLSSLENAECDEGTIESSHSLYILSHSASGGHLARYLLDRSELFLPWIRAVAFTDSTHNIQWAKSKSNDKLYNLLESDLCVYFKGSRTHLDGSKWYLHRPGEVVQTDTFWKHRFGNIKTMWAGTNEHSLTNWFAHQKIWEHFDRFRTTSSSQM